MEKVCSYPSCPSFNKDERIYEKINSIKEMLREHTHSKSGSKTKDNKTLIKV